MRVAKDGVGLKKGHVPNHVLTVIYNATQNVGVFVLYVKHKQKGVGVTATKISIVTNVKVLVIIYVLYVIIIATLIVNA